MKLVRPLAITNANIPTLNINDFSYYMAFGENFLAGHSG